MITPCLLVDFCISNAQAIQALALQIWASVVSPAVIGSAGLNRPPLSHSNLRGFSTARTDVFDDRPGWFHVDASGKPQARSGGGPNGQSYQTAILGSDQDEG